MSENLLSAKYKSSMRSDIIVNRILRVVHVDFAITQFITTVNIEEEIEFILAL